MEPSSAARRTLGAAVARERSLRGKSVAHLAALAQMSHVTWARIEGGERAHSSKIAAVERVLGWETGTAEAILAGQDPPRPDPRVAYIMTSPVFTDEEKDHLLAALPPRKDHGRSAAG